MQFILLLGESNNRTSTYFELFENIWRIKILKITMNMKSPQGLQRYAQLFACSITTVHNKSLLLDFQKRKTGINRGKKKEPDCMLVEVLNFETKCLTRVVLYKASKGIFGPKR